MPIYEYRRPDGTTFEVVQAFSDDPLATDPETGVPVERVLHPPAVHFKGTGFYATDYGTRKRNRETLAAAEGSSSEKDSSGDAGGDGAGSTPSESKRVAASGEGKGDKPAKKSSAAGGSKDTRSG